MDKNVEKMYHRFTYTVNNPVYETFLEKFPKGNEKIHFSVVYDNDNVSYAGIELKKGEVLELTGLPNNLNVIVRAIYIYKEGSFSPKFKQRIAPGYRKKIVLEDGKFRYPADIGDEDIEAVLIDISETWIP